ncbi:LmbE family protein [Pedobacter antarcticus 4BY]|uniref:LmbE family protein n=2 Tax=Pedobacter antarcticus TaxID=34086 RepID=A0A081PJB6_9SPHI|nr:PIG-L family deacetylase [Pedobacter antarcticus]KEQ30789.1 LmbE family protein [Pedobacter antarcticus 4BY]SFE92689.1 N-acetylglucosaminyl deacetylase, LmbE family [Pedobacter antarcticus]
MLHRKYLYCLLILFPLSGHAQPATQRTSAEIRLQLAALEVSGSVLYMAAHPDDENTRLLSYLAKERKVRTGYLSLTRGDGGQNLIGTEQGELLGLIRTQELLAARRMDGAVQFFSTANDFGFSKTSAETLKIWDHQKILGNAVWIIRSFRPDVIITRFPEDERAGHGHHAASAIIAREAFIAAADPKKFPEQLRYVKTWQAKRIMWNTFSFGSVNTTAEDQLKIDAGVYNPILGKSYGEIAAESRTNHKSQGFGTARQRGPAPEYFLPVAGEPAKQDIFDGIDLTLGRNKIPQKTKDLLRTIIRNYDSADPAASLPGLLELKTAVRGLEFRHELLDELILDCAGIYIQAKVAEPIYALQEEIPIKLDVLSRLGKDSKIPVNLILPDGRKLALKPGIPLKAEWKIDANTFEISQPYWLREKHTLGSFKVESYEELGQPEAPGAGTGPLKLEIGGQEIKLNRSLVFSETDPVKGELINPAVIAPPVTATMNAASYLFLNGETKKITIKLRSFMTRSSGNLKISLPQGWKADRNNIPFQLNGKGVIQDIEVAVTPERSSKGGTITLEIETGGKSYTKGYQEIRYDHIPVLTLFPEAEAKAVQTELHYGGKKIAYIAGAGDLIPQSLQQIGYQVTQLSPAQILSSDLSVYDAVITGVRLYNISNEIKAMQPRLLEYVSAGGTLLVQYNVDSPLKLESPGPYPMKLTRERVTEEDAEVTFLHPDHPALNYPNKITKADFEGWIQERGLYFASEFDSRYTALFSMHDLGAAPANGSLLLTKYGKGKFVYTSLAFFRELPAGVPGAYRLFVNLISSNNPNHESQ